MRIRVSTTGLNRGKVDLAVCFAFDGDRKPRGLADPALERELARQMKAEGFRGRPRDLLIWNTDGRSRLRRHLVVGLGRRSETPGESIRGGCARAAKEAARFSARSLGIFLPDEPHAAVEVEIRAAVEGALLGGYEFDRHLTDPTRRRVALESVELCAAAGTPQGKRAAELGRRGAEAVCLARDLVNEAPSRMTPQVLSRLAAKRARAAGLHCKVHGPADLEKLGMKALLAVARGSQEPPRVVHLTYRPPRRKTGQASGKSGRSRGPGQRIVLVGKGVTFDSGGLNLKPGEYMLTMKSDMAGAAAVLATMTALGDVGCSVEVHGLLGLVENMTGGGAYKPGDILDTYAGKTVEVGNTDAEGRLVLCDLLAHAEKALAPTRIVDVATLTGACVVALGTQASGLFSRHPELRDELLAAGSAAGEKIWPMPMYEEYLQLLQKGPADLRSVGGRWGGSIIAALFLGEFLSREQPWAHLDIAGPAFTETELPEAAVGATGAAVLTLTRWLESL